VCVVFFFFVQGWGERERSCWTFQRRISIAFLSFAFLLIALLSINFQEISSDRWIFVQSFLLSKAFLYDPADSSCKASGEDFKGRRQE